MTAEETLTESFNLTTFLNQLDITSYLPFDQCLRRGIPKQKKTLHLYHNLDTHKILKTFEAVYGISVTQLDTQFNEWFARHVAPLLFQNVNYTHIQVEHTPTINQEVEIDTTTQERSNKAHEDLRNLLARQICDKGMLPTCNPYIDLATRFDHTPYLFEVKTAQTDMYRQIRQGMAQLYESQYAQCMSNAKLVIVVDQPFTKSQFWLVDYLETTRNIHIIWKDSNDHFAATNTCCAELPFIIN